MKTDRTTPATEKQKKRLLAKGIDPTGMTFKDASQALNPQHGVTQAKPKRLKEEGAA